MSYFPKSSASKMIIFGFFSEVLEVSFLDRNAAFPFASFASAFISVPSVLIGQNRKAKAIIITIKIGKPIFLIFLNVF